MSKQKREFDIWKDSDSGKIEEMLCPYCRQSKLKLRHATGYESHFSDSDFGCTYCYRTYPVRPFFTVRTLEEVKRILKNMGDGHRKIIDDAFKEVEQKFQNLKELRKKDWKLNPSERLRRVMK